MTEPTTPSVPAGWYPDPAGSANSRWWDGTQWTEHFQQPYSPEAAAAALRAPAGTKVYNVWIWLIILLPFLSLVSLFTIDPRSFAIDPTDPSSATQVQLQMMTSPGYLISTFGGWVLYGITVFFAYRDVKWLEAAGIIRPFHWAWSFLSSLVYTIGRAVVTNRRAGAGIAVLWISIAAVVLQVIIAFVWVGIFVSMMMQSISSIPGY